MIINGKAGTVTYLRIIFPSSSGGSEEYHEKSEYIVHGHKCQSSCSEYIRHIGLFADLLGIIFRVSAFAYVYAVTVLSQADRLGVSRLIMMPNY
jgi:hypothetical protein